jgi:hypothetical protein
MVRARRRQDAAPADPGNAMFDRRPAHAVGQEEKMAYWQIKGLLVLSAALTAITLAASAPA